MAKAFSIRDLMDNDLDLRQQDTDAYEKVSVNDIMLNPKNEYTLSEIEKLKDSIYALGGVQQNIVLVKCQECSDRKYLALDGHRRVMACRQLVNEGYTEFEYIPAVIKTDTDKNMKDAMLVMINSTQRNKSDWEKVMEHMKLKEIIPKLKKRSGADGRTRDIEADLMGVSQTQINIYNTIGTRLNEKMMMMFKGGSIGISLAYEVAKQELYVQEQLAELAQKNGSITEDDIRYLAGSRVYKGQLVITETEKADVSESDAFGKVQDDTVTDTREIKNVSESDTSGKTQNQPVYAPPEKKIVCSTTNKDDIDAAIYFIFRMNDFPESKLQELINCYIESENSTNASISAENRFNKMLPYENGNIRVTRKCGYRVEYIHTGEIHNIPYYYFWEGFKREFEGSWKREETGKTDVTEKIENVSESDTCDELLAAVANEGEAGEQETKFRGGYEPALVDDLIKQYTSYLEIAVPEKEGGAMWKQICKYKCLLDALDLLKYKLKEEGSSNDL